MLDYPSYKKLTGFNDDSISRQAAVLSANKLAEPLRRKIIGKRVGLSIIEEKLTGYNDESISCQAAVLSANKLAEPLRRKFIGKRVGFPILKNLLITMMILFLTGEQSRLLIN